MEFLPLLLLPFLFFGLLAQGVFEVVAWIVSKIRSSRLSTRRRVEAELDRQQAELRETILSLASQLGAEAHEARKALIRESFRAGGQAARDE